MKKLVENLKKNKIKYLYIFFYYESELTLINKYS